MKDKLLLAIEAVRAASRVCRAVQAQMVSAHILEKSDRSPVTVADFASQAVVCSMLDDVPVVGEEDASALREPCNSELLASVARFAGASSDQVLESIDRGAHNGSAGRYWTLDPIDGTKGFLRGEQYAIALALIEDGRVLLGVLGCPNLDSGLIAGASDIHPSAIIGLEDDWSVARPIHVAANAEPGAARFCESVESAHSDQSASAGLAKELGITQPPLRMDSQAKYVTVANGQSHIYLRLPTRDDYRENIWDHAAGTKIIEQAGGRVTDIHGQPLDYSHGRRYEANRGIIATNGPMHDQVISAIAKVL